MINLNHDNSMSLAHPPITRRSAGRRFNGSSWTLGGMVGLAILAAWLVVALGCGSRSPQVEINARLYSPYPEKKLWAVAPFANESGVSTLDNLYVTDLFVAELQQVHDIDTIPVQRVLAAMDANQMTAIQTVGDALTLARLVGADGLIVGSVTAFDPYTPQRLGIATQLYASDGGPAAGSLDARQIQWSPSDQFMPGMRRFSQPVSSVALIVDGANNADRLRMEAFAQGRTNPEETLSWRRIRYSQELYTQFVSHELITDLLLQERARIRRDRAAMMNPSMAAAPTVRAR